MDVSRLEEVEQIANLFYNRPMKTLIPPLALHVAERDINRVAPIYSEDERMFDNIVKGLELQ